MKDGKQCLKKKQPYIKPALRTIKLSAEEVLAVGCKGSNSGFNVGNTPCKANGCSKNGS